MISLALTELPLAAIPLENVVFLVLLIIAAIFRWVSKQAEQARKKSQNKGTTASAPPRSTEEERVRRFLEALGQPSTAPPPPKVTTRPVQKPVTPRPRRTVFSPLPPLTTVPPDLPNDTPIPADARVEPPQIVELKPAAIAAAAASSAQAKPLAPDSFSLGNAAIPAFNEMLLFLKSPRGMRDAMVLREIFGPPRSLQTADLI